MGEVGDDGDAMHAEVGAYAKERGVDALLTLGRASARAAAAFGADARAFDSIDALNEELLTLTPANVLVKGSRSTRMERVVQALEEKLNINEEGARHAT
jgi:murE/murF fusion protein